MNGGILVCRPALLDLGHEPAGVVGQEGGNDAEHGVTEAADVQDVGPLRGLRRGVGLEVDADQLREGTPWLPSRIWFFTNS